MPSLNTKLASAPNTQTNYVLKATSSTTIGNSLIFDDGTNVGIGTTTPAEKLSVIGNIKLDNGAADGAQLVLASSGFSDWNIDNFSGSLRAYYGASVALSISSSLAATFSSSVTASGSFISNVTNGYGLRLNRAAVTNFNGISHATGGVERWFVGMRENLSSNNYVIYNEATGADAFTISTSNNNIGIGTSSITNGTAFGGGGQVNRLKVESGNYTCLEINGSTSGGSIQFTYGTNLPNQVGGLIGYNYASGGDMGMYISNKLNGGMAFATNDTERMRITSSGVVAIATTGNSWNSSYRALQIGNGWGMMAHVTNSDGYIISNAYYDNTWRVSAQSNVRFSILRVYEGLNLETANTTGAVGTAVATTNVFVVATNGNVTNLNNSYGGISDIKLKENIVDTTPKLDDLLKVKVRNYNLKGDNTKQIGVIAQELEQIFPALIEEKNDTIKNENGENIETGETTKSVKYSVFIPMLIKAIQEQQAQIEELKALINK